ncbi:MAG: hypothetical protein P8M81_09205, partial [Litorivicinaceae bacterium]|nr:hypothetical protein [Litorivicinaceae bacterium]
IKNHWLDYTLARNDFKPLQNRPPTPIISGRNTSEVSRQVNTPKAPTMFGALFDHSWTNQRLAAVSVGGDRVSQRISPLLQSYCEAWSAHVDLYELLRSQLRQGL